MADSITPPPELVQLWMSEDAPWDSDSFGVLTCRPSQLRHIAARAAQWGADQELEACCEWLEQNQGRWEIPASLRDARRPKPPSLKDQALAALKRQSTRSIPSLVSTNDCDTIRRALEALPND
jgi:hypothetical protein